MLIDEIREARRGAVNLLDYGKLIANLVFSHQVITASERLLEEAAEESEGDLRRYYLSHIEEERDHAKWLADDLKTAGIEVGSQPLMRLAVEMAGTQYYLIKHVHPAALLGYMATLEGMPFDLEALEVLEEAHGRDILRTLRYHAENDLEHRKELFRVIESAPQQDIIRLSALQTARYLDEFAASLA